MGGDKEFMIREHQVLRWYYEQFQQRLAIGGTRLMVIGYSFSDRHINEAITEAAQRETLTGMFLVDPAGWEVLNPTPPHHIKVPNVWKKSRGSAAPHVCSALPSRATRLSTESL